MTTANITFTPVKVETGRKFRGDAYLLGEKSYGSFGTVNEKLWDPASKTVVYANTERVIAREGVPHFVVMDDLNEYIAAVINETVEWCRKTAADKAEDNIKRFARNVLLKRHPEMQDIIDAEFPDTRNAIDEIRRTLEWAKKLTTRAGYYYGRYSAGGKPLSDERKLQCAKTALLRKGIAKLPGFEEAWVAAVQESGLQVG